MAAREAGAAWEFSRTAWLRQQLATPARPGSYPNPFDRFAAAVRGLLAPAGVTRVRTRPGTGDTGGAIAAAHLRHVTVVAFAMSTRVCRRFTYELRPATTLAGIERSLHRRRWVPLQLALTACAARLGEDVATDGGEFLAHEGDRAAFLLAPAGDEGVARATAEDGDDNEF
jgi:hypothetical protein